MDFAEDSSSVALLGRAVSWDVLYLISNFVLVLVIARKRPRQ